MRRSRCTRRAPRPSQQRYMRKAANTAAHLAVRQVWLENRRRWGRLRLREALVRLYRTERVYVDCCGNKVVPMQRFPNWVSCWMMMAQ
jgi:hypothetical protein